MIKLFELYKRISMLGSRKMKLSEFNDPQNIEEAIDILNDLLLTSPLEEQKYFNESKSPEIMYSYHSGLGRKIRNAWLWPKEDQYSILYKEFEKINILHPDDMSGFLFTLFWHFKHDKTKSLKEHKEQIINEMIIKNILE